MKFKSLISMVALMSTAWFGAASASPCGPHPESPSAVWQGRLAPLYSSHSEVLNDNFYTIERSECEISVVQYGYQFTGIVGFVEASELPKTKPFKRFFSGFYLNHFYTHDAEEENTVLNCCGEEGWDIEKPRSNEGYIYVPDNAIYPSPPVPGTVPLYRLHSWNSTYDSLIHEYTASEWRRQQLIWQGWGFDGIAGYVYPSPVPTVAGGAIFGARGCGSNCSTSASFHFPAVIQNATARPASTLPLKQVMSFTFHSHDFFPDASDPERIMPGAGGHISFALRGLYEFSASNLGLCQNPLQTNCTRIRGAGSIMNSRPSSPWGLPADLLHFESWFVGLGRDRFCPSTQAINTMVCVSSVQNVSPVFVNGQKYGFRMEVSDGGTVTVRYSDPSGFPVFLEESWQSASHFPVKQDASDLIGGFPAHLTGFWLTPANDQDREFTFYVENLQVSWSL